MRLLPLLLVPALLVGLLAQPRLTPVAHASVVLEGRLLVISSSMAQGPDGERRGPEVTLLLDEAGEHVMIVVDATTVIEDATGQPVAVLTLRAGDQLRVHATREAPRRWWATRVVKVAGGD